MKGQSRMDNTEILAALDAKHMTWTNKAKQINNNKTKQNTTKQSR